MFGSLLQFVVLCAFFFAMYFKNEYSVEDSKLLIFFIVVPLYLTFSLRKHFTASPTSGKNIPLGLLLFALTAGIVLLQWSNSAYEYTADRFLLIMFGSFLALFCGSLTDQLRTISIVKTFVFVMMFASIYAILEYFGYIILSPITTPLFPVPLTGHIAYKNALGFLLLTALTFGLHFVIVEKMKRFIVPLLFILFTQLILDSRATLALSVVPIAYYFYVLVKQVKTKRLKNGIILGVLLASVLAAFMAFSLWGKNDIARFTTLFSKNPDSFRSHVFGAQLNMIHERPLLGHGVGSVGHKHLYYVDDEFTRSHNSDFKINHGHNDYLESLAEFGVFGSIFYYSLWILALVVTIRRRKVLTGFERAVVLAVLLLAIHSATSIESRVAPTAQVLWFLLGVLLSDKNLWQLTDNKGTIGLIGGVSWIMAVWGLVILIPNAIAESKVRHVDQMKIGTIAKYTKKIEESLRIAPNNPYVLFYYGQLLMNFKYYDDAIVELKKVDSGTPLFFKTKYLIGYAYREKGQMDSAWHYAHEQAKLYGNFQEAELLCTEIASVYKTTTTQNFLRDMKRKYQPVINTPLKIEKADTSFANYLEKYTEEVGKVRTTFGSRTMFSFYVERERYFNLQKVQDSSTVKTIRTIVFSEAEGGYKK